MLSFQVERWAEFWRDCQELLPIHWNELALDKDTIALGVDDKRFATIDEQGLLHILTVRSRGEMVGYYLAIVMPHLHYKDAGLMAFTDMYFLHPDYRKGLNGITFLKEAERTLKERGVVKMYISHKVHLDHTKLFDRLGWKMSDKAFTKLL